MGEHCMQEAVAHPLLVAHAAAARRAAAEGLVPPGGPGGWLLWAWERCRGRRAGVAVQVCVCVSLVDLVRCLVG